MKLSAGIFQGRSGGIEAPLKWWVGIGVDEDFEFGEWLSPKEAKKLANKILKLCDQIETKKKGKTK